MLKGPLGNRPCTIRFAVLFEKRANKLPFIVRRLGILLGQGVSLYDAVKQIGIVPEGYYSARIAHNHLTSEHACTPLCDAVYRILYEGSTPQAELERVINNSL